MDLPLPPALKGRVLTDEEAEELKRRIKEMPVRTGAYVSVPLVQVRCQDCEANKTVARVRALLAEWRADISMVNRSVGPVASAIEFMADQLQAALDGDEERKG